MRRPPCPRRPVTRWSRPARGTAVPLADPAALAPGAAGAYSRRVRKVLSVLLPGALILGILFRGLYAGWFGPKVPVLQGLSLEQGDAVVALDRKWDNRDPVSKRIGSFYVDDPAVLKRMAARWVTGGPAPFFLCGYNYGLYLVSKGEVKREFDINLEMGCNTIVDEAGKPRWFKPSLVEAFEKDYKKPRVEEKTFMTLESARAYLAAVGKDPRFLMDIDPDWRRFDGEFKFHFPCGMAAAHESAKICLDLVSKRVRKEYPGEEFRSEWSAYQYKNHKLADMEVRITCKESLRKKFRLYEVEKSAWKPLEPKLRVVFKQ